MKYYVGMGHNVPLLGLYPLVQQPKAVGYRYARRNYAASGAVIDELPYVEFEFEMLEDKEIYQALLAQFGLNIDSTYPVSVYIEDEFYDPVLRNGTAVRPLIGESGGRDDGFLKGFVILVRDLREQE
jgi:hypothetical protein